MKHILFVYMIAGVLGTGTSITVQGGKDSVLKQRMFVQMDTNGDRKVTVHEYVNFGVDYMEQKGRNADRRKIEACFAKFDRNGDGVVVAEEFLKKSVNDSEHAASISVSCKVEKKSDRREKHYEKKKRDGDFIEVSTDIRTKSETPTLMVTICNNTDHPDSYSMEWYCFARTVIGDQIITHDRGSEEVHVKARKHCKKTITFKPITYLEESTQRGESPDVKVKEGGMENAGYLVILKYGDVILDKEASSSRYLADDWLVSL